MPESRHKSGWTWDERKGHWKQNKGRDLSSQREEWKHQRPRGMHTNWQELGTGLGSWSSSEAHRDMAPTPFTRQTLFIFSIPIKKKRGGTGDKIFKTW